MSGASGSGLDNSSTKLLFGACGDSWGFDLEKVPYLSFGVPPNLRPDGLGFRSGCLVLFLDNGDVGSGLNGPTSSKSSSRSKKRSVPSSVRNLSPGFSRTSETCRFLDPLIALPPISPDCTALILLATSQPSSVNAYFLSGLPFSCTRSLFTNVVIEFHAV